MTVSDWIALGAAAVAVMALFRPELELLARRWLGRMELRFLGGIELGFSGVGHTIALEGSLRVRRESYHVFSSSVRVVRDDGEHLDLQWSGFRPRRVVGALGPQDQSILSPAPIEIQSDSHEYFHIVYSDLPTRERVANILLPLRDESFLRMREAEVAPLPTPEGQEAVRQHQRAFLNNLVQSGRFEIAANHLKAACFWRSGRYSVQVVFRASDPDYECEAVGRFRLSDEQADRIRNNATVLLFQNVGEFYLNLHFETVPFQEGV